MDLKKREFALTVALLEKVKAFSLERKPWKQLSFSLVKLMLRLLLITTTSSVLCKSPSS